MKIGLLKELIDRVQRGENVDVEGMLGTGDEEKEREWEDGKFLIRGSSNSLCAFIFVGSIKSCFKLTIFRKSQFFTR